MTLAIDRSACKVRPARQSADRPVALFCHEERRMSGFVTTFFASWSNAAECRFRTVFIRSAGSCPATWDSIVRVVAAPFMASVGTRRRARNDPFRSSQEGACRTTGYARRGRLLANLRKPARTLPVSFSKVALKLGEAASQPGLHRGCGSANPRSDLLTRHSVA